MLQIEECVEKLRAVISGETRTEELRLLELDRRIAAEDVFSPIDIPEAAKSAMDGYAVRAEDTEQASAEVPVSLSVIGEVFAGDAKQFSCRPGTAVRIMTGAFVPEGYDAVIRQEDTEGNWDRLHPVRDRDSGELSQQGSCSYGTMAEEAKVWLRKAVKPFTNYCRRGEDLARGDLILKKGKRINPVDIALLAGAGIDRVKVKKKLRVCILSTGSELTEPGEELAPGRIYQNISYHLAALMQRQGNFLVQTAICPDDTDLLQSRLRELAGQSDILITTGGISVGRKDLLPAVLEKTGAELLFRGADIQPGTPTMGAVLPTEKGQRIPVLCLSGNPYAAFTNFEIYFWEMAAVAYGSRDMLPACGTGLFRGIYEKKNQHRRFIRAFYRDGEVRLPSDRHMSSVISNLNECNVFIDLEPGRQLRDGDEVRVRFFSVSGVGLFRG